MLLYAKISMGIVVKITGLLHKLKSEYPISIQKSIYNTLILPNKLFY